MTGAEVSKGRPWYRTGRGVAGLVVAVGLGARLLQRDGANGPTSATGNVSQAAAEPAPPPRPTLPGRALSASELEPSVRAQLDYRYGLDKRYTLNRVGIAEPRAGWLVVELDVLAPQGLTVGQMRRSSLREAQELVELLAVPAFDAVYLYQISVFFPGTDKYGRPTEVDALGVTMKSAEARKVNWSGMDSERFESLVRDVGSLRVHPSLSQ